MIPILRGGVYESGVWVKPKNAGEIPCCFNSVYHVCDVCKYLPQWKFQAVGGQKWRDSFDDSLAEYKDVSGFRVGRCMGNFD